MTYNYTKFYSLNPAQPKINKTPAKQGNILARTFLSLDGNQLTTNSQNVSNNITIRMPQRTNKIVLVRLTTNKKALLF